MDRIIFISGKVVRIILNYLAAGYFNIRVTPFKSFNGLNSVVKFALFNILLALIGINVNAQTQTFTTNGTFTVPAGVGQITVECWGGGGGTRNDGTGRRGGGGGGAYARSVLIVTPGENYSVTVGAGGTPAGTTGESGGNSSFDALVIAAGGTGGTSNGSAGGTVGASTGTFRYVGENLKEYFRLFIF